MNIIDEEYYNSRFPRTSVQSLDEYSEEEKEKFFYEYSIYANWLNTYIFENTSLKETEENFSSSKYSYPELKESEKDIYQYLASGISKYFYVRNNIYLVNLNEDDRNYLKKRISSNETQYDDKAKSFIENTYKLVTYEKVHDIENESIDINYGPESSSRFFASNDDLVIGFRYEYHVNDLNTKEGYDNYINRSIETDDIISGLEYKLSRELNTGVKVIEYNESCVKLKKNEDVKHL